MATLLYLPSSGTAPASPTPNSTDWDGHVNTVSRPLNINNGGTALATETYTPDAGDHLTDVSTMVAQFVTRLLPAQSIPAQTVVLSALISEAHTNNNLVMRWKVYAVDSSNSVLGTLVAIRSDGTEAATVATGRTDSVTSTAFVATVPFRLVLEVGFDGLPTATTGIQGHNGAYRLGETIGDFPQDADTTDAPPYLLFSRTLKLYGSLAAGLRAWFSCEEASGANMVDDHEGYTLTQTNTVGSAAGLVGNARDFESASNMRCVGADAAWQDITGDLTVTCHVNFESTANTQGFVAKYASSQCMYRVYMENSRFRWGLSSDGVHANSTIIIADGFGAPSTATWYFLCGRHFNGSHGSLSINNRAFVEKKAHTAGLYASSTTGFVVGASENGTTDFFDGLIDQIGIWARVLTQAEESYVYNSGAGRSYEEIVSADVAFVESRGGVLINPRTAVK